jgi:hypothetical protein
MKAFTKVTQDGDSEGCLKLDRLPTPAEANIIRAELGIRKKMVLSDTQREVLRAHAFSSRDTRAVKAHISVKSVPEVPDSPEKLPTILKRETVAS